MRFLLIVIGNGGHAQVVIEMARLLDHTIAGICDPAFPEGETGPFGLALLGDDSVIMDYGVDSIRLVIGLGSNARRKEIFGAFKDRGYGFQSLIHPSATISKTAKFGEAVQVMAGAIIQPNVVVGHDTVINTGCQIDHGCTIGDHTHIGPGAILCGDVIVEHEAFVGAGAVIAPRARIKSGTIVRAGSVAV